MNMTGDPWAQQGGGTMPAPAAPAAQGQGQGALGQAQQLFKQGLISADQLAQLAQRFGVFPGGAAALDGPQPMPQASAPRPGLDPVAFDTIKDIRRSAGPF